MLKRCSNCEHCGIDTRALMMGIWVHKCFASEIFSERHLILNPFWKGWRCKNWRAEDGK